jgi:hypothetical protein
MLLHVLCWNPVDLCDDSDVWNRVVSVYTTQEHAQETIQPPPKPGPHLPKDAAELRKASYTMALCMAICLLAALLALPKTTAARWSSMSRNGTRGCCGICAEWRVFTSALNARPRTGKCR